MPKQPHIIIFNPDEMRGDAMHHVGNPAAITPNLDAFAAEDAVSFRNAFCQNPVCVPSRCSFFTGLYPHTMGHRTMANLLKPGESTLLSELKNAGYYVWMNDRNDLTAGQIPGWTESHATEIYYGNQKSHLHTYANPNRRGAPGNKYYYSHFDGKVNGDYYSSDDEIVDAAIDRVKNRPADQPLCMFLGLIYPHVPYEIEEPYFSAIDRSLLPARIKPEDCSGKARILDAIRENVGMADFTEDEWNEMRAVYLGMCMKVDAQFGRLVDALKEEGIYDDCAIFFLSDHGDFTGDYGLPEKAQNTFENCLSRVPFLVKPPKGVAVDPGVSDSLVELVDLYATVMDLTGVTPDHTQFGRSLLPVLADRTAPFRKYAYCEGGRLPQEDHCDEYHLGNGKVAGPFSQYYPKQVAQSQDDAHVKGIMEFDGRYKFVNRINGKDELYDLQNDPNETTNIIGDPALHELVIERKLDMLNWLQATADIVPYQRDERFTPEMLWARARGLVPPEREAEAKQKIADGISFPALMAWCHSLR